MMTDEELSRQLAIARQEFERLLAEQTRRSTIAWAVKVLFGR